MLFLDTLPAVDFSQFMFTSCENDRLGALENLVGAEMGSKIGNAAQYR